MKKINGFINISDYLDDESSIYEEQKGFLNLSGEIYHFKRCKDDLCFRELIAYEIAKYLDIPALKYELALIPFEKNAYDFGVISKDYQKKDKAYISGCDVIKDYYYNYTNEWIETAYSNNIYFNNLYSIWCALEYRYRFNENCITIVERLINQLISRVFYYDILLKNADRHYSNWEIEEGNFDTDININLLFDNEDIFLDYADYPKLVLDYEFKKSSYYENLERFLRQSETPYLTLFKRMYKKINPEIFVLLVNKALKDVKYPFDKQKLFYDFNVHYERIGNILKSIENEVKRCNRIM